MNHRRLQALQHPALARVVQARQHRRWEQDRRGRSPQQQVRADCRPDNRRVRSRKRRG